MSGREPYRHDLERTADSLRERGAAVELRGQQAGLFLMAAHEGRVVEICGSEPQRFNVECWSEGPGPAVYDVDVPSVEEAVHEAEKWLWTG